MLAHYALLVTYFPSPFRDFQILRTKDMETTCPTKTGTTPNPDKRCENRGREENAMTNTRGWKREKEIKRVIKVWSNDR